ncbi:MAG: phosphoglucosamine mutase [Conexivisphaerales archaeon]
MPSQHEAELGRLFGTNGIRGIPGKDLLPDTVVKVSSAVVKRLGKKVAVGRDGRLSSDMLSDLVVSSLLSNGADVFDLGMLPTPAFQYRISRSNFDAGIMITASHNPPEFNGLKVMGGNGVEVPRQIEDELEELIFSMKGFQNSREIGQITEITGAIDRYIDGILEQVGKSGSGRRFRVVVDAGNGMQALAAPKLLEKLGCEVKCINCNVDGSFPGRGPEPVPSKLSELAAAVSKGYDLGVAFDGDGDRSVFCDEKGNIITGDVSGALISRYLLETRGRNKIVTTIATSSIADWAVESTSSLLIRTRVGSVDVTERMIKEDAIAGFEENGGFFFKPHQPVRDGAMTLALMISALDHYREPFSKLLKSMPAYYQQKGKLQCPNELKYRMIELVADAADEGKHDRTDGLKIMFDDGSWVLIRASGTEPLIRIFAESRTQSRTEELYKKYIKIVQSLVERSTQK